MGQLVDTILLSDASFDSMLERLTDFKMKKTEKIGGEPCYVFTLYFPDNEYLTDISTTWYISKNDYLPRKYVKRAKFNGKKDIRTIQFKDLIVNPNLPDSLFTLSTFPEGYEIERPEDRAKKKEAEPGLLELGTQAPDWTLKKADSTEVSLSDYLGQIIILDFWGTWCLPCLEAMPELQRIHEKYETVTVLGASTNEPANADPARFARNRDITYPILLNGEKIIHKYNVRSFPTFYIIDKDGKIIYRSEGYGDGTGKKIEEVLGNYIDQ
ncbi:MAG: redoxin domain-containing protein [Balneolaceae bacterium]|nr:redoxin domain-containing protein [Balneolaceae bacterium]